MKKFLIAALMVVATATHAEVNLFADASTVVAYSGDVKSEKYPTGEYPFIGRAGLEYQHSKYPVALQTGLFIGVSFRHCLYSCKGLVR